MTEKQDSGGIKGSIAKDDNKKAKATAAIPMAGAIVIAALLLSGLSLISSYQQPVIAQQNVTGGGDGAVGGGILEGRNATNGTTTAGGAAAGGNQSTSEVRMNIEQARMTLQNNDTQGAMMYLDMALNALGGNGTASAQGNTTANSTIAGSNAITTGSQNGIPPVGGTSAADEDNDNGANDNGANDNGADGDEEGESNIEGEDPNEFEDCVIVGGRDVGDVGCWYTRRRRFLYRRQACDDDPKGRPVIESRRLMERSNAAPEIPTFTQEESITWAIAQEEEQAAQAAETTEDVADDGGGEDNEIAEEGDDDDADDRSSSKNANRPETDTEEEEDSECDGITVGGTSAADDYGCPPDPDYQDGLMLMLLKHQH